MAERVVFRDGEVATPLECSRLAFVKNSRACLDLKYLEYVFPSSHTIEPKKAQSGNLLVLKRSSKAQAECRERRFRQS